VGIFKDLNAISRSTRESARTADPGARFAEMSTGLAALNDSLARQTATLTAGPGEAVPAQVQVVAATPTRSVLAGEPVVDLDVLVLLPGRPPHPARATTPIPAALGHRVVPGAVLAARVDPANPGTFALDWVSA
jgi:hypothetical protein